MSAAEEEWTYDAVVVGRATRTVDVAAGDGTATIEAGTVRFRHIDGLDRSQYEEEDSYVEYYVSPEGGVGFGLEDGNPGGVAVRHDLLGIIDLPEPMTDEEILEFLRENPESYRRFLDEEIRSDTTAGDLLDGDVR